MFERRVALGADDVPYRYGADCTEELVDALAAHLEGVDGVLFVVDGRVAEHARPVVDGLRRSVRVVEAALDAAEPHKTLASVEALLEHAVARRLTRHAAVVVMGGGTAGNIAGLAAALLYRGTRLVHLPTTPVAAFDSVISAKQGVNLTAGKNLCGTYFPPELVLCDLRWLTTVPPADLLTGLAEMVKNVLVTAPDLEEALTRAVAALPLRPLDALHDLLEIGIDAKVPHLRDDPHERAGAIVFEYGHTVGHAIEFTSRGAIGHGEAVAWGMLVAAEVARLRHGLDPSSVQAHHRLTALLGLPDPRTRLGGVDRAALRRALAADNKRGYLACGPDEVLMVLLEKVGQPMEGDGGYPLVRVPEPVVMAAFEAVAGGGGPGQ
jgi:3-dehydroquinate synthetase